ncbi:MAG TPA: hypothetical protein VEV38_01970, partial [Candidatus Eremiobacteraceae bacterium]|nr:hypothetical protein [Candidatus Eremiobacteraceae bacterium]
MWYADRRSVELKLDRYTTLQMRRGPFGGTAKPNAVQAASSQPRPDGSAIGLVGRVRVLLPPKARVG